MLAKYLSHIINSFRRIRIKIVLVLLKPDFILETPIILKCIGELNLYYGLLLHPAILFNDKSTKRRSLNEFFVPYLIRYLVSLINIGTFTAQKDKNMLRAIGVNECFVSDISTLISPSVFSLKFYDTPNVSSESVVVVYTVITGCYDCVHELLYKQPGVEFYLFTNNKNITSDTWNVVYVTSEYCDILLSREIKMLPHKYLPSKFDVSIYVDANADIYGDIGCLVNFLQGDITMAVTRHSRRTNVLDEIYECYKCGKIKDITQAKEQYNTYVSHGFSDNMGLAECTILIRKHHDVEVISLMNSWWQEFKQGVKRDQISLLPCVKKLSFAGLLLIDGCVWYNQYMCISAGHNK